MQHIEILKFSAFKWLLTYVYYHISLNSIPLEKYYTYYIVILTEIPKPTSHWFLIILIFGWDFSSFCFQPILCKVALRTFHRPTNTLIHRDDSKSIKMTSKVLLEKKHLTFYLKSPKPVHTLEFLSSPKMTNSGLARPLYWKHPSLQGRLMMGSCGVFFPESCGGKFLLTGVRDEKTRTNQKKIGKHMKQNAKK